MEIEQNIVLYLQVVIDTGRTISLTLTSFRKQFNQVTDYFIA